MYRNATLFRIPASVAQQLWELANSTDESSNLQQLLAQFVLNPVGPLEMSSRGFISPYGADSEALFQIAGGNHRAVQIVVGSENRILPGPVVNEQLAKKISEFEKAQARKPGGKLRKQMKDDLLQELMPKAFVKPGRQAFYVDIDQGWVVIDTSSRKSAESAISELRTALGSFPAMPANAEVSPRGVMTGWIAGEPLPDGLALGEECELKDPSEQGATVRCQKQDLRCEEVTRHLDAGKQVTRVGVNHLDEISCVLGEDLSLRKVKLLDAALDKLEGADNEDMNAERDARLILLVATLTSLLAVLEPALKLSKAE